jgi:hypothetical protein
MCSTGTVQLIIRWLGLSVCVSPPVATTVAILATVASIAVAARSLSEKRALVD